MITNRQVRNQQEISHSTDEFVSTVRKLLPKYDPDYIINKDQSGIHLALYLTRALSHKGEKSAFSSVQSKNANRHSFTVHHVSASVVNLLDCCSFV